MRLSEGYTQDTYGAVLAPHINRILEKRILSKLEGFDALPIDFSTTQEGSLIADVLCRRFDTGLVLPIPMRGRKGNAKLDTFTNKEIVGLAHYFDLDAKQLAALCGMTELSVKKWLQQEGTTTDVLPLRTLGILELLRQTLEAHKEVTFAKPANKTRTGLLTADAKRDVAVAQELVQDEIKECATPDALLHLIKNWPEEQDLPLPRQQRICTVIQLSKWWGMPDNNS
jgi:hypothetical protein